MKVPSGIDDILFQLKSLRSKNSIILSAENSDDEKEENWRRGWE